jgi:hypothetical protein
VPLTKTWDASALGIGERVPHRNVRVTTFPVDRNPDRHPLSRPIDKSRTNGFQQTLRLHVSSATILASPPIRTLLSFPCITASLQSPSVFIDDPGHGPSLSVFPSIPVISSPTSQPRHITRPKVLHLLSLPKSATPPIDNCIKQQSHCHIML